MADKQKIQKRCTDILDRLKKGPANVSDLMRITGTGERTLKEDIKNLRDSGNKIELKKNLFTLREIKGVAEHSSKAVVRQVAVILLLSESEGLPKKEIVKRLFKRSDFVEEDTVRRELETDLKKIIERGLISQKDGIYSISLTTNSIKKYNDRVLQMIHDTIMTSGENSPYSPILYDIAEKIADLMRYRLDIDKPQERLQSSSVRDSKESIEDYREIARKLLGLPFQEKILRIKLKTKTGKIQEETIAVERIVYSCESGKMYLIGVNENSKRKSPIVLANIIDVEVTGGDNEVYNNYEINEILDESVVVETAECHKIEVEFDNTDEVREKVERLVNARNGMAEINIENDKIVYTDTIRGVFDFAKILRRFGCSCRIIKDKRNKGRSLMKMMHDSAKETIERYKDGRN